MKKKTLEQMNLTDDDVLARLQERVEKAIATIQELRRERDALKAQLEAGKNDEELNQMRKERDQIRSRIETILTNLESLDA